MAQRVQVLLVCDLHDDDTAGTETITFGLDGSAYEIDVCAAHATALREDFATYVGAGRRAGRATAGSRRPRRSGGAGNAAETGAGARGRGLAVPERGPTPADLAERFASAQR